ncbi:MAG: CRISPR-associated protein Cas4 [Deltaproteobacteria bacterium]|nr:CRISPR-associated protein Cas4 [Deltaproteobacteria bacterium]MBW2097326.1 CRISPR-associated protein Cas4 [Deltaproteobacteria bacterium]
MITPSDVMEYCFCPRFVYFMHCLKIPQHEERRYKVMAGREMHQRRLVRNREYLRKKIGCIAKEEDVYLASARLKVRGRIDEILTLSDGSMAPLDYKFAEYKDNIFKTLRIQTMLYAGLIKERYNREVKRGFICFLRSANKLVEVPVNTDELKKAWKIVEGVFSIIYRDYYPNRSNSRRKCLDCTYKNICV